MSVRDVGDRIAVRYESRDADGTLTNATVVLTVTDPSGTTSTPSVTNTSTGIYDASFELAAAGLWTWRWDVTGNVDDVSYASVMAQDPAPALYATVSDLKKRLGVPTADGDDDDRFRSALQDASRAIDKYCSGRGKRQFWPVTTASARLFRPQRADLAYVDDFWSTSGLVIETDDGDSGTYSTTWSSSDYELEPLNALVEGESYYRLRAVGSRRFPCTRRAGLRVTAKWGWSHVPPGVHEACLILAEETAKLADTPFGVGGYGQFGIIRVRDNPMAVRKLRPYERDPVLVA